jgi:predicted transcriptional regulator
MEQTTYSKIFHNEQRIKIWDLCKKKPRSFSELKKMLGISSGALSHHIPLMKEANLLNQEEVRQGEKFARGKEIKLTSNIKKFEEMFDKETKKAMRMLGLDKKKNQEF